jgi:hypothetical protein
VSIFFAVMLVVNALILIALAWAVTLVFRDVRAHARLTGEPQCNRCGYSIRGLTSWRCPECSSDLLEVGVRGWAQLADRTPSKFTVGVHWFAACAVIGLVVVALASFAWQSFASRRGLAAHVQDDVQWYLNVGVGSLTLVVWGMGLRLGLRYIRRRQAALREAVARRGLTPFPSAPAGRSSPVAPTVPPVDAPTGPGSSVG